MKRLLPALAAVAAAVIAFACGGGGSDQAANVPTPRVDCKANPAQCK